MFRARVREEDRPDERRSRGEEIIWDRGTLANSPRLLVGGDARLIDLVQRLLSTRVPSLIFRAVQRLFERPASGGEVVSKGPTAG